MINPFFNNNKAKNGLQCDVLKPNWTLEVEFSRALLNINKYFHTLYYKVKISLYMIRSRALLERI